MANHFPKHKRGYYEKSSQISSVIQNLRSYQIASGEINSSTLTQARERFGDDDGRVFAAIVKNTADTGPGKDGPPKKHHKRRLKRRRKPKTNASPKANVSSPKTNASPSPPPCKRLPPVPTSSSAALNMLSNYSDSEDSDKLEVPSVIRDMFTEKSQNCPKNDSEEYKMSGQIGYFDGEDSSNEEECVNESLQQPILGTPSVPLSSYVCWKCNNVGHLPKDCTVTVGGIASGGSKTKLSSELQAHYKRCSKIKARKDSRCAVCGIHSNLASCLECGVVLCDGRGHLASHLLEHPTHTTLYSHKLRRMLKCCKVSCDVVNIYELIMCSVCLGKAFTQHYSMISATWSGSGLRAIPNALCCEEHYLWHRMNCPSAEEEHFVSTQSLEQQTGPNGLVSEFFL